MIVDRDGTKHPLNGVAERAFKPVRDKLSGQGYC
jgi:hypothetical protein